MEGGARMNIKIKKVHPNAVLPTYAKTGDAGMDLTATSKYFDEYGNICYGVGLAFEIPKGYVGLIFPRSSICKNQLLLSNAVGVVDSGYRGEVSVRFKPSIALDNDKYATTERIYPVYNIGERVAQIIIMPHPQIQFELVEELSQTERGEGGYGSSGK